MNEHEIGCEPFREGYYEVMVARNKPIVYCDECNTPIEEIWESYVVFPYGDKEHEHD